jgi:hypothetical protein
MNHRGACKYLGCDNHINSFVTDDLVEDIEVIGGVESIMKKRAFQRKLRGLIDYKAGGAGLPAADMEMGDMNFVTLCQFLKYVMVAGRHRVVDIILSGNKEDFHMSHGSGTSVFSLDEWIIFSWILVSYREAF